MSEIPAIRTPDKLIARYAKHFPGKSLPPTLSHGQARGLHAQLDFLDQKNGTELRMKDIETKGIVVGSFVSNGSISGEVSRIHANGQFSIKGVKKVFGPLSFKKRDPS